MNSSANHKRIVMENLNGVLFCDAVMKDEFAITDVYLIRDKINTDFAGKSDVILRRVHSYSVAFDAQALLHEGVPEINNFVYVVNDEMKKESAEFAASSYMKRYNTKVVMTKEEALKVLQIV